MSEPWENWRPTFAKRLSAVLDETQTDAVLEILQPQLAGWAEYENAVTWHTECLSCANMLSSCIKETVRAETAETALASARADLERSDEVQGEMNEKAIGYVREIARLKQQMEELSTALDEARGQCDAVTERAIGCRESLRSSRATVRELREAKDRSVASLLHEAARRMENAGYDDDAVNFLDLLADRQINGFFTDMPETCPGVELIPNTCACGCRGPHPFPGCPESVPAVGQPAEAHGTDEAPLTAHERKFLHFALDEAAEEMSYGDGFTDADQTALDSLRRRAGKDDR